MASIEASIAASERQPSWLDDRVLLTSRSQGLRGSLGPGGTLVVTPRVSAAPVGAGEFAVTLRTTGWGRGGILEPVSLGAPQPGDCLPDDTTRDAKGACVRSAQLAGDGLQEWWGSAQGGLEQGWTLETAPEGVGPVRIAVSVDGAVVRLSDNSAEATLDGGTAKLRYHGLRAWDARDTQLQAWLEEAPEGLAVVVDDQGAEYPIEVDPYLSSAPDWATESDQASAFFGESVASAGDVNDDGYDDVIVGAKWYENGQDNEGAAFLYLGSASGLEASAAWTAESNQVGAEFGKSVASAGDVNGDGFDDVVVGAPGWDEPWQGGPLDEGRAYLYLGSASGLEPSPAWSSVPSIDGWSFGDSVASAGDVNGDGYDDVVVGAPGYTTGGGESVGKAFLYLGGPSGLSSSEDWTGQSDEHSSCYSCAVSSAGDVNNDGYDDLVVGAENYGDGGGAFLYLGSSTGLSLSADWTGLSSQALSKYGISVASAGDVNGDGYADVVIGADRYENGDYLEGVVFLYLGAESGLASSPDWTGEANQTLANFGVSVASAGDVNGDDYDDVLVGASNGGSNRYGAAYLYLGSPSGPSATADWIGADGVYDSSFGGSVASAGDVNGDGFDDVVVGANYYSNGETT